jgi:hypothetical protein
VFLYPLRLVVSMRPNHTTSLDVFTSACLTLITAIGLFVLVLYGSTDLLAQEPASTDQRIPGLVVTPTAPEHDPSQPARKLPDMRVFLSEEDASASLAHVLHALTEVGDGQTYIWHRHHGRLSGTVKPTASFVAGSGRLCRHIIMTLAAGGYDRQTEGVACRLETGRWQLEG